MGTSTPGKLDRVKLTCLIPKEYVAGVKKGLMQLCSKYCIGYDAVNGSDIESLRASFLPQHGKDAMRLALIRRYGKAHVQYDFNPNHIPGAEFQSFIKATGLLAYGCYSHVLQVGTLREYEIAIDYIDQHTSQYLFHKPGVHKAEYHNDGKQEGGSHYVGSRGSDRYVIAYDKAEERHAAGMPYPYARALRIEARFYQQKIKVAGLADIPNPLMKFIVADIDAMKRSSAVEPAVRNRFIKLALQYGVRNALLANFSAKQRAGLMDLMRACVPDWWRPEQALHGFAARAHEQLQVEYAAALKPEW